MPADIFTTGEIPLPGRRRRPVSPHVVLALRANAALRGLGGFLTIFSAFLVQAEFAGGWEATLALGAIAAAAGIGSFAGTAVGSRLHAADPDRIVLIAAGSAAGITVVAAVFYSFAMAAAVALVAAVTNALGKVSLDAIIQREVPESLRASAFARSETVLQLAWVVGGAFGIALPPTGWLGFTVAASLLVLAVGLILWSLHRSRRPVPPPAPEQPAWPGARRRVPPTRSASSGREPYAQPPSPACRCCWSSRRLRQERRGRRPARRRVIVGAQDVTTRPTQYCLDGEWQRYTTTPPILEVSPDTAHQPDRPRRGGRARLERAGLRRAAGGDDRRGRRARRHGHLRRDQHLRRRPAGVLPGRRRGQRRRVRGAVGRLAGGLPPRRRRRHRDAVVRRPSTSPAG